MEQTFRANIRGVPSNPNITEINVRSGPSTNYDVAFRIAVGPDEFIVLDVRPDEQQTEFQDKMYQWLQLAFADDKTGWVRDDLLAIVGDGVRFGYALFQEPVFAFAVTRREVLRPGEEMQPFVTPATAVDTYKEPPKAVDAYKEPPKAVDTYKEPPRAVVAKPEAETPSKDSEARVRMASFNITAAFEGGGYATYQNNENDKGIVSYGRFQFTLSGSSLFKVLDYYTSRSDTPTAQELKSAYLERVRQNDASLRTDMRLKDLLLAAAREPVMHAAQDEVATEKYWNVVQNLSIRPRNIRTPLGQALLFDMGINHGTHHDMIGLAEEQLGVPPKSRTGENGRTEEELIRQVALIRQERMHRLANKYNWGGLKVRGDFWVHLIEAGDWNLMGDDKGEVLVKSGVKVKVR